MNKDAKLNIEDICKISINFHCYFLNGKDIERIFAYAENGKDGKSESFFMQQIEKDRDEYKISEVSRENDLTPINRNLRHIGEARHRAICNVADQLLYVEIPSEKSS